MRQGFGADCAYPPEPDQWVADLQALGCQVAFVYAWGPITRYTAAHVGAALAAGLVVVVIVVPGNQPPPPPLYAAAWPLGVSTGAIFFDVESGSLPGADWAGTAVEESAAAGWTAGIYCTASQRANYPAGVWWRAGTGWSGGGFSGQLPAPAVDLRDYGAPAALQYDFDVRGPSGATYDLSAVDLDVLAPVAVPVPVPATVGPPAFAEEEE